MGVLPNRESECVLCPFAVYLIVQGFVGWNDPSSHLFSLGLYHYIHCVVPIGRKS